MPTKNHPIVTPDTPDLALVLATHAEDWIAVRALTEAAVPAMPALPGLCELDPVEALAMIRAIVDRHVARDATPAIVPAAGDSSNHFAVRRRAGALLVDVPLEAIIIGIGIRGGRTVRVPLERAPALAAWLAVLSREEAGAGVAGVVHLARKIEGDDL